jgi:hypothetical protein
MLVLQGMDFMQTKAPKLKKENKMKKVLMITVFLLAIGSLHGQAKPKVNQATLVYRDQNMDSGEWTRIYAETCNEYKNDGWREFEFTVYDYSKRSSREWYSNAITPLWKVIQHMEPSYEVWTVNFEYKKQTYILILALSNQDADRRVLRR